MYNSWIPQLGMVSKSLRLIMVWVILFSVLPTSTAWSTSLEQSQVSATVQVAGLNVRSGPGTNYSRISTVKKGDVLTVLGQNSNCAWLQIRTAQNVDGWVAGAARYVKLSAACSAISTVSNQTAITAPVNPTPTDVSTLPPTVAPVPNAATATPLPPPPAYTERPAWLAPDVELGRAAELEAKVPLEAGKACVLFQNFMGGVLQIALNNQKDYSIDLFLEPHEERPFCLPPGLYFFYLKTNRYSELRDAVRFYPDTRDVFSVFGK